MSCSQKECDLGGNSPSPSHSPEDYAIAELPTTTAEGQQNATTANITTAITTVTAADVSAATATATDW